MTEEQYLALDEATDGNYEFYEGYVVLLSPSSSAYDDHAIIDLAGGNVAHSALCTRLASLIDQALKDGSCLVHSSDVKVEMPSACHYFHPDVSVACDDESCQILTNPVVIESYRQQQRSAIAARNLSRTRSCRLCKRMSWAAAHPR